MTTPLKFPCCAKRKLLKKRWCWRARSCSVVPSRNERASTFVYRSSATLPMQRSGSTVAFRFIARGLCSGLCCFFETATATAHASSQSGHTSVCKGEQPGVYCIAEKSDLVRAKTKSYLVCISNIEDFLHEDAVLANIACLLLVVNEKLKI